mgnify:CR=1 FL=1
MAKLNIVLYEPEIPANTGNIGRTCVATGTKLHLIEPLGFSLSEKALKRAGMDYWSQLEVERYVNYEDFLQRNPGAKIYMATTKAKKIYSEASYEPDCYIMFGKESAGIPEEIYEAAHMDGAGERACFFRITLPNLLPSLYTISVLSFLNSFKVFREAWLVAGDYPQQDMYLLQHLYNNWFRDLAFDKISAAAVLTALVVCVLILLLQRAWEREI